MDFLVLFIPCLTISVYIASLRRLLRLEREESHFQREQSRLTRRRLYEVHPHLGYQLGLKAYDEIVAIGEASLAAEVRAIITEGRRRHWSDDQVIQYILWHIGRGGSDQEAVRQMMSFVVKP